MSSALCSGHTQKSNVISSWSTVCIQIQIRNYILGLSILKWITQDTLKPRFYYCFLCTNTFEAYKNSERYIRYCISLCKNIKYQWFIKSLHQLLQVRKHQNESPSCKVKAKTWSIFLRADNSEWVKRWGRKFTITTAWLMKPGGTTQNFSLGSRD